MKTKALILGLIALTALPVNLLAQGKGGGSKPDSVTGITVTPGSAGPTVTWKAIDKATYQVKRWKSSDTSCCNNASASGLTTASWQDTQLPSSGTYVYRVTATTNSGQVLGDAQFSFTAPVTTTTTTVMPIATVAPPPTIIATVAPAPITAVTTIAPPTATGMVM